MVRSTILPSLTALCVFTLVACGGGGHTSPRSGGGDGNSGTPNNGPDDPVISDPAEPRSRYSFANRCFVLRSQETGDLLQRDGTAYSTGADEAAAAAAFYMKPTALGSYVMYNRAKQLMTEDGGVTSVDLADASPMSEFVLTGVGDTTNYPEAPAFNVEPTAAEIAAYRSFNDPNVQTTLFTLTNDASGNNLTVNGDGALTATVASASNAQFFRLEETTDCAEFPEASSNTIGESYKGTTKDGRVLGMVDGHVHISSTTFLGQAQWGSAFHEYGVTHALDDCDEYHGPQGERDVVGGAFTGDTDGHDISGFPTFVEWPARNSLLHEAIYWKWVERAWKSGLRVIVNDLVDNETLCEIQRNVRASAGDPEAPQIDCNSMNNAGRQAGSMYAMQDYIDAQYGGRGKGFYQIVHDSAEGRAQIEAGNAAVVLGIEISNLVNCKVNFAPTRTQEPFEEDGAGPQGSENVYVDGMGGSCTEESIVSELQRIWDWGVRQVITIHEFDNAFGGNGIFGGIILNLGSRENAGGVPGGTLSNPTTLAGAIGGAAGGGPGLELPTGEFWTTYDCPVAGENGFEGYLYGGTPGDRLESVEPTCAYMGQGGRPGGATPCYPAEPPGPQAPVTRPQCNARWLTPRGLFMYSKLMEFGFIFDIDHLELEMKTQGLELAEAQDPPYPFVSTHGTFGGTSIDQAKRMFNNGGFIYPSLGNAPSFINDMNDVRAVYEASGSDKLFGFGFGTDTNGLSGQSGPRSAEQIQANGAIEYPYTLFDRGLFAQLPDFNGQNTAGSLPVEGVTFQQPEERDPDGNGRTWHLDVDGSAHYGMMSGLVQEMNLHGTPQNMQDLFNSAEQYLRTWKSTEDSNAGILNKTQNDTDNDGLGNVVLPDGVLRAAPLPSESGRNSPL